MCVAQVLKELIQALVFVVAYYSGIVLKFVHSQNNCGSNAKCESLRTQEIVTNVKPVVAKTT